MKVAWLLAGCLVAWAAWFIAASCVLHRHNKPPLLIMSDYQRCVNVRTAPLVTRRGAIIFYPNRKDVV